MPNKTEVLITGAGPVGLTLAAQLNSMGIQVTIMDQRETRSQLSKAGVVWGRSLELLDLCMNADDFLQTGRPLRKALIFSDGHEIAAIDFAKSDHPFGTGVMIPQNETERLLTEHLESQGVSIRRGMELKGFEQHAEGVHCEVSATDGQREQWQADYLVGCDGAHSTVRHSLDLDFPGQQESHRWLLADVSAKGNLPDSEIVVCWSRTGILVMFRFTETTWRLIAEKPPTNSDTPPCDPTLAEMQALMNERGIENIELYDPNWLSEFRINERKVDQYQVDRVFLAGDAAHIHSPVGGQGMNTGIQDACNLAWKIAWSQKSLGQSRLLQSYTSERSRIGDLVVRTTSHATKIATVESRPLQWMRKTFAKIALHFDWTQELARQNIAEYTISYPDSLIQGLDLRKQKSNVRLGERVPDLSWTTAQGDAQSLYQTLRGGHAVLIGWKTEKNAARSAIENLPVPVRSLFRAVDLEEAGSENSPSEETDSDTTAPLHEFGTADPEELKQIGLSHAGLVLIRPDGYLAAAGEPEATSIALQWLNTIRETESPEDS